MRTQYRSHQTRGRGVNHIIIIISNDLCDTLSINDKGFALIKHSAVMLRCFNPRNGTAKVLTAGASFRKLLYRLGSVVITSISTVFGQPDSNESTRLRDLKEPVDKSGEK